MCCRESSMPFIFLFCFFRSQRRRHTRLSCDWSSDVCSSDRKSTRLNSSHTIISYAVSFDNLVCRLLLEKKKHTSELQSHDNLVCPLLLEKKKKKTRHTAACTITT